MPLYEYECDACGGRFEVIQKFSETTAECRNCGKGPVRRLVAAPAFQFKGTGWYITDYAQKGKTGGESESAGQPQPAKTDAKSDGAATSSPKTDASASPPPAASASKQ